MNVLDTGYCKLIETWGSDERIIEAARMSTDGGFKGWGPKHEPWCESHPEYHNDLICTPKPGDEKLLAYLWHNKHLTPFEMAGAIIEVQAPIMVFREWHRHRTQSYNELSARYTELPDSFYLPSVDRLMAGKQSAKNKQGSEGGFTLAEAEDIRQEILANSLRARATYEKLLNRGVAREIARLVIPVNQYSRMRASANLRNWLAFLTLRMDESAQWEIRQYANALHATLAEHFPRTLRLFDDGD